MKISYKWLQEYFGDKLPEVNELAEQILTHSYEVEEILPNGDDFILDLDISPNRAHDSLSHYGVAKEVSAVLDLPLKKIDFDLLKESATSGAEDSKLSVNVLDDKKFCRRYIGCVVENVVVGESHADLKTKIESIGERSINNIVDITNIVMFELGQPMHAFDKDKLDGDKIFVRPAIENEEFVTLDNKNVLLSQNNFLIADEKDALAIAGVKGGKKAEVDANTKNLVVESANFDSVLVGKTSRSLNIMTESSKRYENEITSHLAEIAMWRAIELIKKYASDANTKVYKTDDYLPRPVTAYKTGVSIQKINRLLGVDYSQDKIADAFRRLGFGFEIVKEPRAKILDLAKTLIGRPYKYGASVSVDAPNEFDCSSFVSYLFKENGLSIPRSSIDQMFFGTEISEKDLVAGDLIFGNSGDGKVWTETSEFLPGSKFEEGVDHVGIYLGDGQVIHASQHNATGVEITKISDAKSFNKIVGYRKYFEEGEIRFAVTVPFERLDLKGEVDLVEEVGRILGYENVQEQEIDIPQFSPKINPEFYVSQKIKEVMLTLDFSEVMTYSFVKEGEIGPKNPIADDKKFLRAALKTSFEEFLNKNILNADWLMLDQLRIFEIGKVHKKDSEILFLGLGVRNKAGYKKIKTHEVLKNALAEIEIALGADLSKIKNSISDNQEFIEIDLTDLLGTAAGIYPNIILDKEVVYKKISNYPFMTRDIAVWIPSQNSAEELLKIIKENAGDLLIKEPKQFDRFEKEGRVSYAYRLVFQSYEKTLTDDEVNKIMENIYAEIRKLDGWEIR